MVKQAPGKHSRTWPIASFLEVALKKRVLALFLEAHKRLIVGRESLSRSRAKKWPYVIYI